jgi:hypothetical protein
MRTVRIRKSNHHHLKFNYDHNNHDPAKIHQNNTLNELGCLATGHVVLRLCQA